MLLRPYQEDAARYLANELFDEIKVAAFVSPTGSGKSVTILAFISQLLEGDKSKTHFIIAAPQRHIRDSFKLQGSLKSSTGDYKISKLFTAPEKTIQGQTKNFFTLKKPGTWVTTHAALTHKSFREGLPKNCKGVTLIVDEAHHMSDTSRQKTATILTQVAQEVLKRGGHVIYTTASPFRADGHSVLPENVRPWTRSIAEHIREGFAPKTMVTEVVPLKGYKATTLDELLGESVPTETGSSEIQIYKQWVKDGKPKTIINVPQFGCDFWAEKIQEYFESKGSRVYNSIGEGKSDELQQILIQEKKCKTYQDSQYEIILACKRFDEGSDWPLCSHFYRIGISKNIHNLLQQFGRTQRLKYNEENLSCARFPGMPKKHLDNSVFRFFIPEGMTENLGDQLWKGYQDLIILLACHMHNYETGQKYSAVLTQL